MNGCEWLRTFFGMGWQEWDINEMNDSGRGKWDGRSDSQIVISFISFWCHFSYCGSIQKPLYIGDDRYPCIRRKYPVWYPCISVKYRFWYFLLDGMTGMRHKWDEWQLKEKMRWSLRQPNCYFMQLIFVSFVLFWKNPKTCVHGEWLINDPRIRSVSGLKLALSLPANVRQTSAFRNRSVKGKS